MLSQYKIFSTWVQIFNKKNVKTLRVWLNIEQRSYKQGKTYLSLILSVDTTVKEEPLFYKYTYINISALSGQWPEGKGINVKKF